MAKGPEAFRTISEAADELGVGQHVLRFWETKFSFIRPMKRAGGRRFYRPQDIDTLRAVKHLLHDQGRPIKDVQGLHKQAGIKGLLAAADGPAPVAEAPVAPPARAAGAMASLSGALADLSGPPRERLERALADLRAVKARLDGLLA